MPVKKDALEGEQTGETVKAKLNFVPFAANRFRWGVLTPRLPYGSVAHAPRSSAMITRILGGLISALELICD